MIIPNEVAINYNLSSNEKFLYGLILENTESDTYICCKTNAFFASHFGNFGVTERTIRNYICKLKKEGLIGMGNIGKIKNAIFIIHKDHFDLVQSLKNKNNKDFIQVDKILEKFFQHAENIPKDEEHNDSIINLLTYIVDLFNQVLVSNESKNYINNSASARVDVKNPTVNKFSDYETAGKPERARFFDYKVRSPYINVLYRDFFTCNKTGRNYELGKEIIDNMIEAYEKSKTNEGFIFNHKKFKPDDLIDCYFNITNDEFTTIVNSLSCKKDIRNRSPYILGAIIQRGTHYNWKKTNILVKQGYPWNVWVPGYDKELSNIVFDVQKKIQREKDLNEFIRLNAGILPGI